MQAGIWFQSFPIIALVIFGANVAAALSLDSCDLPVRPPCQCLPSIYALGPPSIICANATGNEIASFMDEIPANTEIENLTITDSPISRLTPFSFGGRISVRRLTLNRNGLSLIHTLFFVNSIALDKMEELDLSDNLLTEPPRMINRMENIRIIRLRNNRIPRLPTGAFDSLPKLEILDLSENRIGFMDYKSMSNLSRLIHVDLSDNKLEMIGPGVMEGSFAQPDIEGRIFVLCGNPWVCDERLEWLRLWLRGQRDIKIETEECKAVCSEPHWLKEWPLRSPDPKFSYTNDINKDYERPSKDEAYPYSRRNVDAKPVFDFLEWILSHLRFKIIADRSSSFS